MFVFGLDNLFKETKMIMLFTCKSIKSLTRDVDVTTPINNKLNKILKSVWCRQY